MKYSHKNNVLEDLLSESNHLIVSKRIQFSKELKDQLYLKTDFLPETWGSSPRIYCFINNIDKHPICSCGNKLLWSNKFNRGFNKTCGNNECIDLSIKERIKDTCLEKYGVNSHFKVSNIREKIKKTMVERYSVDTPYKSKIIIEKSKKTKQEKYGAPFYSNTEKYKKTCIERYGVDSVFKIKYIKDKANKTLFEKYGVYHPINSDILKEKFKNTCLEKYGVDNPLKNKTIRDKLKETNIKKYGFDNPMKSEMIKEKSKDLFFLKYTKSRFIDFYIEHNLDPSKIKFIDKKNFVYICPKCGYASSIYIPFINQRIYRNKDICLKCLPIGIGSSGQNEISDFIENLGIEIIKNYRLKNKKEIDIYIPSLKLGIEYNGLYWHQELYKGLNYHIDKTEQAEKEGIQIIHIWEDQWILKRKNIESLILSKLGKNNKIYARNCNIQIIDSIDAKKFIEENHLQGYYPASINLGLLYNHELVSLMTLGKRKSFFELLRFCSKKNITVIGGASKLFKYFINNYDIKKVISYANRDISNGRLYEKMGFKLKKKTRPSYWWVYNNIRFDRNKFQKHKLVNEGFDENLTENEIMYKRRFFKIYNSGNLCFEYIKDAGKM